jgi:hypothetical protein
MSCKECCSNSIYHHELTILPPDHIAAWNVGRKLSPAYPNPGKLSQCMGNPLNGNTL